MVEREGVAEPGYESSVVGLLAAQHLSRPPDVLDINHAHRVHVFAAKLRQRRGEDMGENVGVASVDPHEEELPQIDPGSVAREPSSARGEDGIDRGFIAETK